MRVKHLTVTRNRSIPGALAAAVLLSLLVVGSASGALFVILEPTSGPPGTEVTGRTGGDGAFASQVDPLPTYLVAKAAADSVTSPEDPGLIPIGELIVDEGGNGRISFLGPLWQDYAVVYLDADYRHTVIAHPGGRTAVLPFATAALARAGTGDVLAGAIVGLRAQGLKPFEAAVLGGYLHGRAGEIAAERLNGSDGVLAGDVADALPAAIAEVRAAV